jgi:hypothetical protein
MDKAPPVIVARTWTDSEAAVIKSLLESYNIPCHYSSELPHRIYPVSMDTRAQIRIYVPAVLEEEAIRVLEEHRRRQAPLHLVEDEEKREE